MQPLLGRFIPKLSSISSLSRTVPAILQQRKHKAVAASIFLVIIILYFASSYLMPAHRHLHLWASSHVAGRKKSLSCLQGEVDKWSVQMRKSDVVMKQVPPANSKENRFFPITANGKIGYSLDNGEGQFYLIKDYGHKYVNIPYAPTVTPKMVGVPTEESEVIILSIRTGSLHRLKGYKMPSGCVIVQQRFYAHRVHSDVLVQEISVANNGGTPVQVTLSLPPIGEDMDRKRKRSTNDTAYHLITSEIPGKRDDKFKEIVYSVGVSQFPESIEVKAFESSSVSSISVLAHNMVKKRAGDVGDTTPLSRQRKSADLKEEEIKLAASLTDLVKMKVETLWQQHVSAWNDTFQLGVGIGSDEDPNSPSPLHTNLTEYYLYSSMSQIKPVPLGAFNMAECFSHFRGAPSYQISSLWVIPRRISELLSLQATWLKLATDSGCIDPHYSPTEQLLAFREALALSFMGWQYQRYYLQLSLNPLSLASNLSIRNIPLATFHSNDLLSVSIVIAASSQDKSMIVSCRGSHSPEIFGCAAACEKIVPLTAELVFPVMATEPVTPLFYVSSNHSALESIANSQFIRNVRRLRHRHDSADDGHHRRLGAKFWLGIVLLIVGFHVIVFKMIYNECRKSDRTIRRQQRTT